MTHSIMFAKYKKIMMALTLFASVASVNADCLSMVYGNFIMSAMPICAPSTDNIYVLIR